MFSEQLVDTAGPELTDVLQLFAEKKNLLLQYTEGGVQPNPTDTRPDLHLSPGFKDFSSPFLTVCKGEGLFLRRMENKTT